MLIRDLIIRNARRHPNKIAYIFDDSKITYKQLNERVNQLAMAMLDLKMEKGDRIAILADNCIQYPEIMLAGAKTGMIYVPVNTMLGDKDITHVVTHTEASTLFFSENYAARVSDLRLELKTVKNFVSIDGMTEYSHNYETLISAYPAQEPQIELDENDLFCISYTSGTTGMPKGVMASDKNRLATASNSVFLNDLNAQDVLLGLFPYCTPALPYEFLPALYVGATFVGLGKSTPQTIFNCIEKEKVTILICPTGLLIPLIEGPELDRQDLSTIRRVLYAGGPMPVERLKKLLKVFEGKVTQNYGLTECISLAWIYAGELVAEGTPQELRRLASCGREALNTEVRVVDEFENDVAPGEIGEIICRGDEVMVGYWKMPEATSLAIRNGYLYTGDMGTVDDDGYIYLSDRKKDTIFSQGHTLFPREIEEIIYQHPAVLEAAVVGVPEEDSSETIRAFVVLKPGGKAKPLEIKRLCEEKLPPYALPKTVELVSVLPKNPTGKVLRRVLREQYLEKLRNRK